MNLDYTVTPDDSSVTDPTGLIVLTGPGFYIDVGDEEAKMYSLRIDKSVDIGTYYLTIKLYDEVSKTITITVN